MSEDQGLLKVLHNLREAGEIALEHARLPLLERLAHQSLSQVAEPIIEVMKSHSEFGHSYEKYCLGRHLHLQPAFQASNLLRRSIKSNPQEAINWYRKLMCSKEAEVRITCRMAGFIVEDDVEFSNGVKLVSLDNLPKTARLRNLRNSFFSSLDPLNIPGFALLNLGSFPFLGRPYVQSEVNQKRDVVKETIEAFCLDGFSTPTVSETWVEFTDLDFEDASVGIPVGMNDTEGPPPRGYGKKVEEGIPWVESYLKLPEETRSYLRLPISRLNMAMRDFTPENKAIDGSISLDALIGSGKDNHVGHELGVKSALILGTTAQERDKIYYDVKEFYSLRNEAVHPGKKKEIIEPERTASRGLEICVLLLQKMISRGEKLEWGSDFADKGGPLWNRSRWDIPSRESKRPQASKGV